MHLWIQPHDGKLESINMFEFHASATDRKQNGNNI